MPRTGETCRGQERCAEGGRVVPRTGESCRGRERRAEDGKSRGVTTGSHCHQRVGTVTRGPAATSEGRHGRQRLRDGLGVAWMDMASPGWTWRPRDGRGDVHRDVEGLAASVEDRKVRYRNLYRRAL